MATYQDLITKYNVPVPRYTSYPSVPDWELKQWDKENWLNLFKKAVNFFEKEDGVSVYIHLPYCESLCTYCGCNTRITVNHTVERPYIQAILNEWAMYTQSVPHTIALKEIHLGGGTPTFFSPQNLSFLVQGLMKNCTLQKDYTFSFEAHPANTTEAHLQTLFNLGFKRLSLGVQDFDSFIQKVINRKQSFEELAFVVNTARKIGYTSINLDIIYGLPFQKVCSIKQTIDKVLALKPDRIAYYSYAHVPWKHPGQRAYGEKDLPDNVTKRNLYEFGKKSLLYAGYVELGMDHFAFRHDSLFKAQKQGDLHRNFMGYVPKSSSVLVGLGVSAISDIHFAYAQNAKTVEGYLLQVNNQKLAIQKGHVLSEKDLLTRKIILDLMCNERIPFSVVEVLEPEQLTEFKGKLTDFLQEGILITEKNYWKVTEFGKKFIRNIAVSLDERQFKESKTTFSKSI